MTSWANVVIDASQFPEKVRCDLLESLRTRRVNHKFHYDSVKQTQKWLALHQAHAPPRNDLDCATIYDRSFEVASNNLDDKRVQVVGLGCGGGQKDTRLLNHLCKAGKEVFYTPCDVSTAMVLVARQAALSVLPEQNCFPFVCDLATAKDLAAAFDRLAVPTASRIVTFFGMIPNFEPQEILPKLASLVRADDHLLFSANLAPGSDYAAGMQKILSQYDNPLTRDWLMTLLLDLGVEQDDGELHFLIEQGENDLMRVVARFRFNRNCQIQIDSEEMTFGPCESIQLFFSYRYTHNRVQQVLGAHGLEVRQKWITKTQEEGVFLCRKDR